MLKNLDDDDNDKQTQEQVYDFVDGDHRKSFLHEHRAHALYLCISHTNMTSCKLSDNNYTATETYPKLHPK